MNCRGGVVRGTVKSAGVTAMLSSVAEDTVSVVLPDTPESVAVIVVEPPATAAARPLVPASLLIVATVVDEEFQTTDAVRSWLVVSE